MAHQSAESQETRLTSIAVEAEDPFDGASSPTTNEPLVAHEPHFTLVA